MTDIKKLTETSHEKAVKDGLMTEEQHLLVHEAMGSIGPLNLVKKLLYEKESK